MSRADCDSFFACRVIGIFGLVLARLQVQVCVATKQSGGPRLRSRTIYTLTVVRVLNPLLSPQTPNLHTNEVLNGLNDIIDWQLEIFQSWSLCSGQSMSKMRGKKACLAY